MKSLTENGFTEETLSELKGLCTTKFGENPALYFVLYKIAEHIEDAFGNQAMPIDMYNKYAELIPLINSALKNQDITSINDLIKPFAKVSNIIQ